MIFNGREVADKDVMIANEYALSVLLFGFPEDVDTADKAETWTLEICEGDEWLADFCAFVTVVMREVNETGCTQEEAMAKYGAKPIQEEA